ncbi:MAG: nicotinamide-nucleotide amidohydrolase family protein [Simkaniaceae bacterium]|nr:nicotinamide-nucleotide amidohydrolase family protein [Simkaniaceae bacterium]
MKFKVISIGNELLSGDTINTNAAYLGKRLSENGYDLDSVETIRDVKSVIKETFQKALQEGGVIIVTGGLGNTHDDLTAEVACSLFKIAPTPLQNRWGTADGWNFEGRLFLLPGVPVQMQEMFEAYLVPYFLKTIPTTKTFRTVNLALLSEDIVDPFLLKLQAKHPGVEIGICPSYGKLAIHFSGKGDLTPLVEELRTQFSGALFEDSSLSHVIHRVMIEEGLTLALAESCTGGYIASSLCSIPGASAYFLGSMVCYSNQLKEEFLGVKKELLQSEGAVSEACANAMAAGLKARTKADYVVAVTGVAGPSGGTEKAPVGTVWLAIGDPQGDIETFCLQSKGRNRTTMIEFTTQMVLARLWKQLTA